MTKQIKRLIITVFFSLGHLLQFPAGQPGPAPGGQPLRGQARTAAVPLALPPCKLLLQQDFIPHGILS